MASNQSGQQYSFERPGKLWVGACASLLLLSSVLGWFENTTLLTPHADEFFVIFGLLSGFISIFGIIVLFNSTDSWPYANSIGFSIAGAFLSFIIIMTFIASLFDFAEGMVQFPADKTQTFKALIPIVSASHTQLSKSVSWTIKPAQFPVDIQITRKDWEFMVARQKTLGIRNNSNIMEIDGYFCANAIMQKSSNLLRIVYGGTYYPWSMDFILPSGSIVVCPSEATGKPYLKLQ
ncbi:hypothetical protein GRI58_08390 [Porphyrobacter algicida]|uniref:Uncharacterized protein n=1 Tax=Qipengyuania algicida TaxID=1836209 RepID=A0A845APF3_9SPHN|nr:hypothetical protein [Qipengyuania algicida]MXP28838.1 hypothetical protein [Qipengyuania algicida]